MADVPEVGITAGVPTSGTGTVQTLSTVNDKLVILSDALGAAAGAKVATDDDGTIQQYLRGIVSRWADALGAGTAAAALRTSLASDDPAVAALALVNSILGETDSDSAGLTTTDLLDGSQAINAAQLLRFCAEYLKDLKTNSDLEAAATGAVPVISAAFEFELVAASQTAQVIGATGAAGDYLSHVVVSPATVGCGVVTILDNATAVVSFPGGGTSALSNLIPFAIPVGMKSVSGAWKITTGANVSCAAVGDFT